MRAGAEIRSGGTVPTLRSRLEMRTDSIWLRTPKDRRTTAGTLDERELSPQESNDEPYGGR
jgi:hypothetical protein